MKTPAPETRPGNPVLLVVLVVLALVTTSLYFREGEGGPLRGMRRGLLFVTTPVSHLGEAMATPFTAFGDWLGGFRVTRSEVDQLKKQNDEMRAALAKVEEEHQQNVRLQFLFKLSQAFPGKSVAARVIGRPTDSWEGSIIVDRGTVDGVVKGTPVVAAQGLLGQVSEVAPNSAKVRLITDQSSGVAALVQSSRATGIVHGSVEGGLSLDFVDAKRAPKVGDVIVTSGLGGAYPKGLVVGDVTKVEPDPAGLFPHVTVVSRVPINDIEEVAVLVGMPAVQAVGGIE